MIFSCSCDDKKSYIMFELPSALLEWDSPFNSVIIDEVAVSFPGLNEFIDYLEHMRPEQDGSNLELIKTFPVLKNLPENYKLYLIVADYNQMDFYYLPDKYTKSTKMIIKAQEEAKCMCLTINHADTLSIPQEYMNLVGDIYTNGENTLMWCKDEYILSLWIPIDLKEKYINEQDILFLSKTETVIIER